MTFDVNRVRDQFPALEQYHNHRPVTFFDGPGGTQIPQSVLDAMVGYLGHFNSNLGGHYFSSKKTTAIVSQARASAQALLNAPSSENIIFGANMTSLTFQLSRAISRDWKKGDEIIVTALDHYANVSTWQQAASDKGVKVHQARIIEDDCSIDMAHLKSLINERTKLIAVTYASNTTGMIVDIPTIIQWAHENGAMVYVDAVHYAPHNLVDVQALNCDFLVCSAYKFYGPHLGIAYMADKWLDALEPYKVEPATNIGPGRFETGTQSFEALAGLIATVEYLAQHGDATQSLRERLEQSYAIYVAHEQALSEQFLHRLSLLNGVKLYGDSQCWSNRRTPTFALTFDHCSPEFVAKTLGEYNICVWSGHFYALGLIRQLGLEESGGVVRIGCMHYNTQAEIDMLFDVLETLLRE